VVIVVSHGELGKCILSTKGQTLRRNWFGLPVVFGSKREGGEKDNEFDELEFICRGIKKRQGRRE
jgi:hypothetical protein